MRSTPLYAPDGLTSAGGDPERFAGIRRDYTPADVERLSGSFRIRHTLAEMGAARLWHLLKTEPFVNTLGALTGNQAVQQVKAGLKAIYLSGWQVAGDANSGGEMYPDQSLYPVDSVPKVVRNINNALRRCDQIAQSEGGKDGTYWMAPIVADAEAGFGGPLNAYELMRNMIANGAAGVHFEDQLASEKKCGHLGGKVLVPISQHIRTLNAARLAADVEGVNTVLLCRTDAQSAQLLTSDVDERDRPFISGERTPEGFFRIKPGCRQRLRHRSRSGLCAILRPAVVGDVGAEPEGGRTLRQRDPQAIPRQDAGVQLLAQLQLGEEAAGEGHRGVPARDRQDGLPVPVRDAGRVPQPEPVDVQPGARLQGARHGGLQRDCSRPSSRPKLRATPRPGISGKWASGISTRLRWRSRAASRPPRRSPDRPRRISSTTMAR